MKYIKLFEDIDFNKHKNALNMAKDDILEIFQSVIDDMGMDDWDSVSTLGIDSGNYYKFYFFLEEMKVKMNIWLNIEDVDRIASSNEIQINAMNKIDVNIKNDILANIKRLNNIGYEASLTDDALGIYISVKLKNPF